MTRALAALLTQAIDYAGVFPPAKLDLVAAYKEYIRYGIGPESWILGKFAVRSTQLAEFAGLLQGQEKPAEPIPVTVIGRSGVDKESWEAGLQFDASEMNTFQSWTEEMATLEAYETRLPSNAEAALWITNLRGFGEADVFAELPWDDDQADALLAVAESEFAYAKARTGGESPSAFPDSTRLASFIQGATHLDVPFKLTAGLHHARPFHASPLGARMHGFLNAYAAVAFSIAHDLSIREMASVLDNEQPRAFALNGRTVCPGSDGLPTWALSRRLGNSLWVSGHAPYRSRSRR